MTQAETLETLRDQLRRGECSATQAIEAALERAQRADPGTFITLNADAARSEAERAGAWVDTSPGGPGSPAPALPALHGVPLAHKDLLDVHGVPTSHGSAVFANAAPATRDDPRVATLREAGAISIGKTQVPEFGLTGYSENTIAPPARNPFDPSRTAGGSSGGSAAAVAAGVLPAAPGSDGGGSIRIPALACGLIGLKPGRGVIPGDPALKAVDHFGAPEFAVSGPLANNALDAAILFDAMRGRSALPGPMRSAEPSASAESAVRHATELTDLRIGVSSASPFEGWCEVGLSLAATTAFDTAVASLLAHGHEVIEADVTYATTYPEDFTTAWSSRLLNLQLEPTAEERLMPLTRYFLARARARSASEISGAAARLREFAAEARRQWGAFDAVLTPGLAFAAPAVGAFLAREPAEDYRLQCEWAPYTSMVNVAGLPAIAVPVSCARVDGVALPFGVQLIGRAGSESQLLQLAAQFSEGAQVPSCHEQ